MEEMAHYMAEIEKLLAAGGIEWEKGDYSDCGDAFFYMGKKDDWNILVVSFPIEGSRGYDGTAVNRSEGVVMRLTRGQAEAFYGFAMSSHEIKKCN